MVDVHTIDEDVPQVVIEPPKPSQPRPKQYYVLKSFEDGKIKAQLGKIVLIPEADALSYVSARFLVPLDVALREKMMVTKTSTKEGFVEKVVEAVTGTEIPDAPTPEYAPKKSFLGNRLREAIQAKKAESSKIDADKLAAIRAGGSR